MNEKAMMTFQGEWYTIHAPLRGPNGFSFGALADSDGNIIMTFRRREGEYFTTTDELVEESLNYLKSVSNKKRTGFTPSTV